MEIPKSGDLHRILLESQRDEITDSLIYHNMAKREKDSGNRVLLERLSNEEREHAGIWEKYTDQQIEPNRLKIAWFSFLSVFLGYTFVLKLMKRAETEALISYQRLVDVVPEAARIQQQELNHENELIDMLNEERLQHMGAMMFGLNDALVKLTSTMAGLTFALMNTRVLALCGIVIGISGMLSMTASNYLYDRAANKPNAITSSVFAMATYFITMVLLLLPYFLLPAQDYIPALILMIVMGIGIMLFINFYISVPRGEPFVKRFMEMALISLIVTAVSFLVGHLVKTMFGVSIGQ